MQTIQDSSILIKQVIDGALKAGLFPKIEDAVKVGEAYSNLVDYINAAEIEKAEKLNQKKDTERIQAVIPETTSNLGEANQVKPDGPKVLKPFVVKPLPV